MTTEEIKNKFQSLGLLKEEAVFELYAEGEFTYHLINKDGTFYSIGVINNQKLFRRKEKVFDLVNDIHVQYLSLGHYEVNQNGDESRIGDLIELKLSDFLKK